MPADVRIKELRQKDVKELEIDLKALHEELFKLRFQSTTEKLANPSRIGQIRRQIARINTLQRERVSASANTSKG